MKRLKLIQADYLTGTLKLSRFLYTLLFKGQANRRISQDKSVLAADLPRTKYFFEGNLSVEALKSKITHELTSNPKNQYSQGDLDARFVYNFINFKLTEDEKTFAELHNLGYNPECDGICYLDDNNQLCGVSITLVANTPVSEPVSYRFAITIFKNITGLPNERKMLCIIDDSLLCDDAEAEDIADQQHAINMLRDTLQSKLLFPAISAIIKKDQFASKEAFEQLKNALKVRTNAIDQACDVNYDKQLTQAYINRNKWPLSGIAFFAISSFIAIVALTMMLPLAPIIAPIVIGVSIIMLEYLAHQINKNEASLKAYVISRGEAIDSANQHFIESTRKTQSPEQRAEVAITPKSTPSSPVSSYSSLFEAQSKEHSDEETQGGSKTPQQLSLF